jgi:hypothetical protein
MQLLRGILLLLAAAAAAAQVFQERYRLSVLERRSGPVARDEYEARRRRGQRAMTVLAALSAVLGVGALVYLVLTP